MSALELTPKDYSLLILSSLLKLVVFIYIYLFIVNL